jgi:hypothetical protein
MISAYEHGWNAARLGKHIQACPFDSGTAEWQEWRDGFLLSRVNACQEAFAVARGVPRTSAQFRSCGGKYHDVTATRCWRREGKFVRSWCCRIAKESPV